MLDFYGNTEEVIKWFRDNIQQVRISKYDIKENEFGETGQYNRKTIYFDASGIKEQMVLESAITGDNELKILFNSGLEINFVKDGDKKPRDFGEGVGDVLKPLSRWNW